MLNVTKNLCLAFFWFLLIFPLISLTFPFITGILCMLSPLLASLIGYISLRINIINTYSAKIIYINIDQHLVRFFILAKVTGTMQTDQTEHEMLQTLLTYEGEPGEAQRFLG